MRAALGLRRSHLLSLAWGLSLFWLCLLVLSVTWSLEAAGWLPSLPSLSLVALLGLGTGLALAHLPGPQVLRLGTGLLTGAVVTLQQTLTLIPAAGWWEGMRQVGQRLGLWLGTELGEPPETLPLVLILVSLSWLWGYFSAWLAFAWQRGWLAVLTGGIILLSGLFYGLREGAPFFFLYLGTGLMLLMNLQLAHRPKTRAPTLSLVHHAVLVFIAGLLVLLAWLIPISSDWLQGKDFWFRVGPWRDMVYGFERLFPMLAQPHYTTPAQAEANWLNFGTDYPFQGERNPRQEPVLRVWAEWPAYWRATTYEIYSSEGWAKAEGKAQPLAEVALKSKFAQRQELVQRVELLRGSNQFLMAGQLLSIDRPAIAEISPGGGINALRPLSLLKPYQKYQVVSLISTATSADLRQAGNSYPAEIRELYMKLPEGLPPQIQQLAEELSREATTPYDKATAIQRYLRQLPYRTDIPAPPQGEDGVSYFLFSSGAGYCDYYASAMAVMLRSIGIPARLAVGFASGQYDKASGVFLVTENETHSWPEVFFPHYGWVEFEPTPIRPVIQHGSFPTPPVVREDSQGGANFEDEFEALGAGGELNQALTTPPGRRFSPWAFLSLLVLLALPLYWWQRGLFRKSYEIQTYERMCRLAALCRLGHKPNQTPREYAQSLALRLPPLADDIKLIALAYEGRAYGGRGIAGKQKEEIRQAWSRLRRHLLRRIPDSRWRLRLS